MTNDFTVCISIGKYPFAEMGITSLRHFYPNINVIVTFDIEEDDSKLRRSFFNSRGIQIVKKTKKRYHTGGERHAANLDMLIHKYVKTKYCIVLDDDTFMYQEGLLEKFHNIMKRKDFCGSIWFSTSSYRFNPYCMALKTNLFKKYNMTFKSLWNPTHRNGEIDYTMFPHAFQSGKQPLGYDTGSFVLMDCFKYNLKVHVSDFMFNYVHHFMRSSYKRLDKNIMEYCNGRNIAVLEEDMFLPDDFSDLHKYASKITNEIIEKKEVDFSVFFNRQNNKKEIKLDLFKKI